MAHGEYISVRLGHCNGEVTEQSTVQCPATESDISVATFLSASEIAPFAGLSVTGLNVGLPSVLNMDNLTVWVRSDLDGPNLVQTSAEEVGKGWNFISLDETLPIDGSALYVGYTYHQRKRSFGVGTVPGDVPGGAYYNDGSGWTDISESHAACIEALVEGDMDIRPDLALTSLELPSTYSVEAGELHIKGEVLNKSFLTTQGYAIGFECGDCIIGRYENNDALNFGESTNFDCVINPGTLPEGNVTVRAVLTTADNETYLDDNVAEGRLRVTLHDYTRRILIEEFSTEQCTNCPRVAGFVKEMESDPRFAGRINLVGHHAGYNTDWLTTEWDEEYLWFYNNEGRTFAPALMLDRHPFTWSSVPTPSPCWYPYTADELAGKLEECLSVESPVTVCLSAFEEEGDLRIKVTGHIDPYFRPIAGEAAVTVVLVEDNVQSMHQVGAERDYMHNGVNRDINATWGEPLDLDADTYNYECVLSLPQQTEKANVRVVAFVHARDFNDPCGWEVYNSNSLAFADFEIDGIDNPLQDVAGELTEYYTLQGIKVDRPSGGIYIERRGKTSRKVVF